MKKIICIGNRFVYPDSFGMEIYDILQKQDIENVEIIEGGLGGLNLALYFDTTESILIIDHGVGFDKNILSLDEIKRTKKISRYDHDTALYYLINSLENDNIHFYISNDEKWDKFMLNSHIEKILKLVEKL